MTTINEFAAATLCRPRETPLSPTFQLDTTGFVMWARPGQALLRYMHWVDLTPFTQGYIEALFGSVTVDALGATYAERPALCPAFSDLAPETLARIIADCEGPFATAATSLHFSVANERAAGRNFWNRRQAGGSPFPPLTVQLGGDGKVRFAA